MKLKSQVSKIDDYFNYQLSRISDKHRLKRQNKFLNEVRIKGNNINISSLVKITRPNALVLGSNLSIRSGTNINATAGVAFGNDSIVEKNTKINSSYHTDNRVRLDPIVIGNGNIASSNVAPGTILNNLTESGLSSFDGDIVFVLSTGRAGSKAISVLISENIDANCYHDAFQHLHTWSCDLLYGNKSHNDIKLRLKTLYDSIDLSGQKLHAQSDSKLAAFCHILNELYPKSKFIWLVRDAKSFVNSAYSRGWFNNSEFGYQANPSEFLRIERKPAWFHGLNRLNGYLANEHEEDCWKQMTAFERNCWYWQYWNAKIENFVQTISKDRWIQISLVEMSERPGRILQFLGKDPNNDITLNKINKATYTKISSQHWSAEMERIFEKHCADAMNKWFKKNN